MPNFLAVLGRARGGIAAIIAVATFVVIALSGVVVISGLTARIEKLESDHVKMQARIVELAASQSRLRQSIDAADRSIKSLRSDFDSPRVQPLASILDSRSLTPERR